MNIDILIEQIELAKRKSDGLISKFSKEQWFETPDVLETNLNWQIGHIILANYLHGIASISGVNEALKEKINIPEFIKFYGPNSDPKSFIEDKPSTEEIMEQYDFMFTILFSGLENIKDIELKENTAIPNPSVQTKYEALSWLSQHQSWHNGQIATLKRVLDK